MKLLFFIFLITIIACEGPPIIFEEIDTYSNYENLVSNSADTCDFLRFVFVSSEFGILSVTGTQLILQPMAWGISENGNAVYVFQFRRAPGNGTTTITVTDKLNNTEGFNVNYTCYPIYPVELTYNNGTIHRYMKSGNQRLVVFFNTDLPYVSPYENIFSLSCVVSGFTCQSDTIYATVTQVRIFLEFDEGSSYLSNYGDITVVFTDVYGRTTNVEVNLNLLNSTVVDENEICSTPSYNLTVFNEYQNYFWSSIQVYDPAFLVYSYLEQVYQFVEYGTYDYIGTGSPENYTMYSRSLFDNSITMNAYANYSFVSGNFTFEKFIYKYVITSVQKLKQVRTSHFRELGEIASVTQGYTNMNVLVNFEITALEPNYYLMEITAKDDTGIKYINVLSYFGGTWSSLNNIDNLAYGNSTFGTYHSVYTSYDMIYQFFNPTYDGYRIQLFNNGEFNQMYLNQYYYSLNPLKQLPPFLPPFDYVYKYSIDDFTDARFEYNNLDLSGEFNVSNSFFFKVKGANIGEPFYLSYERPDNRNIIFSSKWNVSTQEFQIDFYVPPKMFTGQLHFNISLTHVAHLLTHFRVDWMTIQNKFGEKAILRINSKNADQVGPIINKVYPYQVDSNGTVGWEFSVSDIGTCGFKEAIVSIGSINSLGLNYTLLVTNQTSQQVGITIYSFKINITNVCEATLLLEVQETMDWCGNTFLYNDAFMYIPYTDRLITVQCGTPTGDLSPAELVEFNVENSETTVDVGSLNRTVSFNFTLSDVESGVYIGKPSPIVSLTEYQSEKIISCSSTWISSTDGTATFRCEMELPYGFGYPLGLSISVKQITNNALIVTETNIPDSSSILNIIHSRVPLISSVSSITTLGGKLFIYGNQLGNNSRVFINYNDGNGYQLVQDTPFLISPVVRGIMVSQTLNPINIRFENENNNQSNIYIVEPEPSPFYPNNTNQPTKCLGTPLCGGEQNGKCTDNGCKCISPWIGEDCLSRTIILPQPKTNTTHPTTPIDYTGELPNGETVSFSTLISIVEIREIDYQDNIIERYVPDIWIFTNQTSLLTGPASSRYLYATNITKPNQQSDQIKTTDVHITLDWFSKTSNVTFANEIIPMSPSTIKYTININTYPFSSQLNRLVIVMSASINNNDQSKDSCSAQQFNNANQDNSEFQYVKLQINSQSLYGRFIKRGILDDRIIGISNQLINDSTSATKVEANIGIIIPFFYDSAILDPDFSVLINTAPVDEETTNSKCQFVSKGNDKLSKSQLAGIIIGAILFGLIIIIVVCYIIYKRRQDHLLNKKLTSRNQGN